MRRHASMKPFVKARAPPLGVHAFFYIRRPHFHRRHCQENLFSKIRSSRIIMVGNGRFVRFISRMMLRTVFLIEKCNFFCFFLRINAIKRKKVVLLHLQTIL